jgi:hypothetical protein
VENDSRSTANMPRFIFLIDLRTQLSQQLMDSRFIGMIVSCFNKDSDLVRNFVRLHSYMYVAQSNCPRLQVRLI